MSKKRKKLFWKVKETFDEAKRKADRKARIKEAMRSKNIPFNTPFGVEYKNNYLICKIDSDINGEYELKVYCGGIWLPANKEKITVSRIIFGDIKIYKGDNNR